MSANSLICESNGPAQDKALGVGRRRGAWRLLAGAAVVAGALWNVSQAADLAPPTQAEPSAPQPAPPRAAYASRLEQIAAEQGEAPTPKAQPAAFVAPPAPSPAPVAQAEPPARLQAAVARTISPAVGGLPLPAAAPDLFGSTALAIGRTPMDAKWRTVSHVRASAQVAGEIIADARGQGGYEQLVRVNRWVNRHIAFADDARAGPADHWANADESLRAGAGDCEDYAIAKMQILEAAGFDQRDLYLVLVRDLVRRADHAILVARVDGRMMVLDSNTDRILPAEAIQDYRPMMSFSGERSWIHGYRQAPAVMLASNAAPAQTDSAAGARPPEGDAGF